MLTFLTITLDVDSRYRLAFFDTDRAKIKELGEQIVNGNPILPQESIDSLDRIFQHNHEKESPEL